MTVVTLNYFLLTTGELSVKLIKVTKPEEVRKEEKTCSHSFVLPTALKALSLTAWPSGHTNQYFLTFWANKMSAERLKSQAEQNHLRKEQHDHSDPKCK